MEDTLITKLLEAQLVQILAATVFLGVAFLLLSEWNRRRGRVVVPGKNGDPPQLMTKDEAFFKVIGEFFQQLNHAAKEKETLAERLRVSNDVNSRLASAVDRFRVFAETNQRTDYEERNAIADKVSSSVKEAADTYKASLDELTKNLDKRLEEMRLAREESRSHMEEAEKQLKEVTVGQEQILERLGEVAEALRLLANSIEQISSANAQALQLVNSTLNELKLSLNNVASSVPRIPNPGDLAALPLPPEDKPKEGTQDVE